MGSAYFKDDFEDSKPSQLSQQEASESSAAHAVKPAHKLHYTAVQQATLLNVQSANQEVGLFDFYIW